MLQFQTKWYPRHFIFIVIAFQFEMDPSHMRKEVIKQTRFHLLTDRWTDRTMDRWTKWNQYAPLLLCWTGMWLNSKYSLPDKSIQHKQVNTFVNSELRNQRDGINNWSRNAMSRWHFDTSKFGKDKSSTQIIKHIPLAEYHSQNSIHTYKNKKFNMQNEPTKIIMF